MSDPMLISSLLAFGMPGGPEWIVLLVLGLLIFGRRLPEVGRSLGRGIVEFKKGIKGIEDEIEESSSLPGSSAKSGQLPQGTPAASATPTGEATTGASVGGEKANPYRPSESD